MTAGGDVLTPYQHLSQYDCLFPHRIERERHIVYESGHCLLWSLSSLAAVSPRATDHQEITFSFLSVFEEMSSEQSRTCRHVSVCVWCGPGVFHHTHTHNKKTIYNFWRWRLIAFKELKMPEADHKRDCFIIVFCGISLSHTKSVTATEWSLIVV